MTTPASPHVKYESSVTVIEGFAALTIHEPAFHLALVITLYILAILGDVYESRHHV